MRLALIIPPNTHNWLLLRIAARNLARKHPDVVVISHWKSLAERQMMHQLNKCNVQMGDYSKPPVKPKGWWGRARMWWSNLGMDAWDPLDDIDVLLVFSETKYPTSEVVQRAKAKHKKVWVVHMGK